MDITTDDTIITDVPSIIRSRVPEALPVTLTLTTIARNTGEEGITVRRNSITCPKENGKISGGIISGRHLLPPVLRPAVPQVPQVPPVPPLPLTANRGLSASGKKIR
jgi:hypothetical protein